MTSSCSSQASALSLLGMPVGGVARWHGPQEVAPAIDLSRLSAVREALSTLKDAARAYGAGGPGVAIDVSHLSADGLTILDEILGQGEVQAILAGEEDTTRIQEAVMPGLWRIQRGKSHALEVGDVPELVRKAWETGTPALTLPDTLPEGAMNVRPVLAEIKDAMARVQRGGTVKEINLTLLPMTPDDLNILAETLGQGPLTLLSRGYGNCRITACAVRGVWRISYFNTDDKMILDMIEVGDVPTAAVATREDVADSVERLDEVIKAYWP